jgi:Uma2 family endonuclease
MTSLPIARLTPKEFLERDRAAEQKHEYWHGEVFAMEHGSPAQSLVTANVGAALGTLLRGRSCYVFNRDLRVVAQWDELITYPHIAVLCGKPEYADDRKDTLTNPAMIVEVRSPSSRKSGLGDKASLYRQMPSMREILLVDPAPTTIEHSSKLPNGRWELEVITDRSAMIQLPNVNQALPVVEIYRDIEILSAQSALEQYAPLRVRVQGRRNRLPNLCFYRGSS